MPTRAAARITIALLYAPILFGASGTISGRVAESDGNASGFAEIIVVEQTSGISRMVVADAAGAWRTSGLEPGSYEVTARSAATHTFARSVVELHEGESFTLPVKLSAGWTVFEIPHPASMPFASSGYLDGLEAGSEITRGEEGGNLEGYGPYSPRGNFGVNSVGQRAQDNNFELDGMDNNDPLVRGPVIDPSPEEVRTVSLVAVYTPAAEGHQTGAVVNMQTQSGGGAWHGSGFDFFRNSVLDARNFFDGATKPGTTGNQFGGSIGGPAAAGKDWGKGWFLFGSIDAIRARDGLTVVSTVPTAAEKAGSFGAEVIYDPLTITQTDPVTFVRQPFANNQIPASLISAQAQNVVALYPNPNLAGLANNYRYAPSAINNSGRYALRTDKEISPQDRMFARVNFDRNGSQSPSALPGAAASDSAQHADDAAIQVNALAAAASQSLTIRPDTINELRAGFTRLDWNGTPADQTTNSALALGVPGFGAGGMPVVSPEGYAQLGSAQGLPGNVRSASYELKDTLSFVRGRHHLDAGVQMVRRHVDGDATDFTSRGTITFAPDYTSMPNTPYTGNSIASMLLNDPDEVRQDVQLRDYRLRGWELAGFVQDTLRIGKKLLVTAGLRYSYDPPVTEADNRMVNFNYSRTNPASDQFAGQGGVNSYGGLSFNKRTIAPRIGFAWDLSADGSTVLRGGFSQDYDPGSYMAEGALARNAPYETQLDLYNGTLQLGRPLTSLTNPFNGTPDAIESAIYAVEPKSYTPYADQWGVFLDRRLMQRLSAELSGSGSMGIHLYESYNINQPFPAPTPYAYERYPYPSTPDYRIQYLGFAAGSTYYGGQAKISGRINSSLQIMATYRFAKSLDDATQPETTQDSRPTGPQYIYDLRGNRSVSPFDVPQRVIITASYNLPLRNSGRGQFAERAFGDWRLDCLTTLQSGLPFTPVLATNGLNNGGYQLPNRMGTGTLPSGEASAAKWFNTSLNGASPTLAFVVPAPFQYGDSGFDILRGEGLATFNAALSKKYAIGSRIHLQTRIEGMNLFNRTNLALPNAILGLDNSGAVSHTATASRNIQLVARVNW